MESSEVVGAHEPDEADPGMAADEPGQRVISVACVDGGFEACDVDAGMAGEGAGGVHPLGNGRQKSVVFQRVTRRHEPPDAIQLEAFEGDETDEQMGLMGRVERAADEADAHAAGVPRKRFCWRICWSVGGFYYRSNRKRSGHWRPHRWLMSSTSWECANWS